MIDLMIYLAWDCIGYGNGKPLPWLNQNQGRDGLIIAAVQGIWPLRLQII
jgi:hypothetical protein